MGKGKAHVHKMGAILTDSHLDTRIIRRILMIAPKLEYAGKVMEGNAKLVKQLEAVQITAAKKVLLIGCSNTTGNTALRAELGMYQLKINRREKVEMAL